MMIVRTVQQEDNCSWQDASKPWMEQDEGAAARIYQVGTCRGADGVEMETGEEAAGQPPADQCKEAGTVEAEWQAPGPDDLLLEGEEGEYFLELLMRKASPERPKADRPMEGKEDLKGMAASPRAKIRRRARKRPSRKAKQWGRMVLKGRGGARRA
jgi:hypothetical protein